MTKRRTRAAQRDPSRAEIIALERRSSAQSPSVVDPSATGMSSDESTSTYASSGGVLPPRTSRMATAGGTLSRAQEMVYIRSDLRRLVILAGIMLAILAVLAIALR